MLTGLVPGSKVMKSREEGPVDEGRLAHEKTTHFAILEAVQCQGDV